MTAIFTTPITKKDIEEAKRLTDTFTFVKFPKPIKKVKNRTTLAYRGRKRKKRSKVAKIKIIPYKTLFNKAVNLFQTYIRNRDKCCVIGRDIVGENKRCYGYLTCGHLISRGKKVVLFDEKNSNGQCQGHNGLHRNFPEVYNQWWINHYGVETFNKLVEKSKVNDYKWPRKELEKIISKYSQQSS